MERLWDSFNYMGMAEWHTAVFRTKDTIPIEIFKTNLRDLGLPVLENLLRKNIDRFDDPYQKGMLTGALAGLLSNFGDDRARAEAMNAIMIANEHPIVVSRVNLLLSFLNASAR